MHREESGRGGFLQCPTGRTCGRPGTVSGYDCNTRIGGAVEQSGTTASASADGLIAGAARLDLEVEPGLPGPGLRLWGEPFVGQESPLSVGAFVATAAGRTAVIIATDLLFVPDDMATRIRERAAAIAGTTRELVLLNASHDHAVPPLPHTPYEGGAEAV